MVVGLQFDPILEQISPDSQLVQSSAAYRAIFGDVSHEKSSKFEQRKGDHVAVWEDKSVVRIMRTRLFD